MTRCDLCGDHVSPRLGKRLGEDKDFRVCRDCYLLRDP